MTAARNSICAGLVLMFAVCAEEPAPAAAPAPSGSATAPGKRDVPQFPLKSDLFNMIIDSYDDQEAAQEIERGSLEQILIALTSCTREDLVKNIDPKADFRALMTQPEKFRGHVVGLRSVLRHSQEKNLQMAGLTKVWQGEVADISGQVISFISLEEPPEPGKPVEIIGVFMKRYAYVNRQAGEMLQWTPLVLVHRIVPIVEKPEEERAFGSHPLTLITFGLLAVAIFLFAYARNKATVSGMNTFTRARAAKEGPRRMFPGPKK